MLQNNLVWAVFTVLSIQNTWIDLHFRKVSGSFADIVWQMESFDLLETPRNYQTIFSTRFTPLGALRPFTPVQLCALVLSLLYLMILDPPFDLKVIISSISLSIYNATGKVYTPAGNFLLLALSLPSMMVWSLLEVRWNDHSIISTCFQLQRLEMSSKLTGLALCLFLCQIHR